MAADARKQTAFCDSRRPPRFRGVLKTVRQTRPFSNQMHYAFCLAKPMLPEPFCGSLSSQLLSNIQKITCITLGSLFGLYPFFHQSCATGTLLLQKGIYPQKSLPNLRQLIFCRLLSRDSPRGRGDSSQPRRSRDRCVLCRFCRVRHRQDWSRPSCRSPLWPPEASLYGCR